MHFNCTHCNQPLEVDADMEGQSVQCPSCGRYINIPVSANSFKATIRATRLANESATTSADEHRRVIITKIDLSILDLMILFLKCIIAMIPIWLMFAGLAMLVSLLLLGSCSAALMNAMPHP